MSKRRLPHGLVQLSSTFVIDARDVAHIFDVSKESGGDYNSRVTFKSGAAHVHTTMTVAEIVAKLLEDPIGGRL